jgi:hypothetical protein
MFKYIFYSIGNGAHESTDDVAIIRAWSLKQAKKRLQHYVNLDFYDEYLLYKLKMPNKVHFISNY